ncbi:GGDEF domain-containing protein [Marinomonas sp. GJ51-6]|uniref:GGDEF domain-containing protein n=1 Tax=Marinomonas sp. GJ51-6 TaxID=2992802 RepID=UPI0029345FF6|nr:GGDEF domain-containing protein [Marinomonas sp. GJ51-6]WOD08356.1 GGDEF domain-containing protein [Marinomonas sp. GJ51-6]
MTKRNETMLVLNEKKQTDQSLHRFVRKVGHKISVITVLLSAFTLLGYAFNIEFLYRPMASEPATNPLTALVVLFLALGLELSVRSRHKLYAKILAVLAVLICGVHLVGFVMGNDLSQHFMLFSNVVEQDLLSGKNNSMGMNTTLMLLLLAFSLLLYIFKFPIYSQLLSFTSLCIPMVSITGYAYGLTTFYGAMSILSTTFGVFLCVSALAITANKGGVKAVLSPYIGGRIARMQIVLGYFVPLLIGYLVIRSLVNSNENSIFGVYVVAICWFIALLVVVSAIVQEQVDRKRREMEKALKVSAMTDELTSLPNRRYFMQAAAEKLEEQESRSKLASWFLMIDIDHFKKINDAAGHEMGDRVLVEFGKTLKQVVGSQGLLCRLGGEEFSLLLPSTSKDKVEEMAETILRSVESMVVPGYTDIHGRITTSIGCGAADQANNVEYGLKLADEALYCSKSEGRNRVMFAA